MEEYQLIRKWLAIGIILLLIGVHLFLSLEAKEAESNVRYHPAENICVDNRTLLGDDGQLLFLTKFYGKGVTSLSMNTFARGFRFILPFEFVTADSYVYVWYPKFSHFWSEEWNFTGPEDYHAIFFFGKVVKVHEKYVIEGYCLDLYMFPFP